MGQKKAATTTTTTPTYQLAYDQKEAAEALRVCKKTIERYIIAGHIRVVKLDRKVIIPGSEIRRILEG